MTQNTRTTKVVIRKPKKKKITFCCSRRINWVRLRYILLSSIRFTFNIRSI